MSSSAGGKAKLARVYSPGCKKMCSSAELRKGSPYKSLVAFLEAGRDHNRVGQGRDPGGDLGISRSPQLPARVLGTRREAQIALVKGVESVS